MTEFTPGPWRSDWMETDHPHHHREWYEIGSNTHCVGEVYSFMHDDEGEANARLIAAAPALFKVSDRLLQWRDSSMGPDLDNILVIIEEAEAALELTKGDES